MNSEAGSRQGSGAGSGAEAARASGELLPDARGIPLEPANGSFAISLEVRDYELDAQGIVNNANYLHYFEHARHSFLRSRGVDFVAMHDAGLDAVVHRVEVEYAASLRSGERFTVSVAARREGRLRMVFEQEARKEAPAGGGPGLLCSRARVVAAIVKGVRPVPPPEDIAARLFG
jgi:acyl-CoA thioester hydrolase